jgi:Putative bacterial sensory transduction regulator
MKYVIAAGALALAFGFSSMAGAKDLPAGGVTWQDVTAWLQSQGYKAQMKGSGSEQNIESAADGGPFHIYLYDCKGARCGSLQFSEGFDTKGAFNAAKMNDWNQHNRWARAHVDKTNDPWLEMDCDLTPGGTYELLNDEFATWRMTLRNFRKQLQ